MPKPESPLHEEHRKLFSRVRSPWSPFPLGLRRKFVSRSGNTSHQVNSWQISRNHNSHQQMQTCPFPYGLGHFSFNLTVFLPFVNRQSTFAKQHPAWVLSNDHIGSIGPCANNMLGADCKVHLWMRRQTCTKCIPWPITVSTKTENTCTIKPSCCLANALMSNGLSLKNQSKFPLAFLLSQCFLVCQPKKETAENDRKCTYTTYTYTQSCIHSIHAYNRSDN